MQKKYVLYYDFIKIVAAYMVCFYHLGLLDLGSVTESFYIPNLNRLVLNFCAMSVPLFFMVNGALLLRRSYAIKEVAVKFVKLTILYYFWVIVIGEIGACFFQVERLSIGEVLTGTRTSITVHLWFFKTIARLALLTPVFKFIYDYKSKVPLYGMIGCLLICPFVYNYFVLFVNWLGLEAFSNLPVTGVDTMYSVLYFLLGKMISDISREETVRCMKQKIVAVISIIIGWILVSVEVTLWTNIEGSIYDGVNSSFPTIGALLMAVGVFYLLSKVDNDAENRMVKIIKICADNIIGVYIFHPIIVHWICRTINNTVSLLTKFIITLMILVGLVIFTRIMKKIPVLKRLVEI